MKHLSVIFLFALAVLTACSGTRALQTNDNTAYVPADKALYDTIAHQDSLFFAAFNHEDLEAFKQFLSPGLEVFQDNTGVRNYEQAIEAFGQLFQKDYILTRTLVKGSLEVYPIKDYGAIETGRHTFCHTENGKPDCGTFKFLQIWEHRNGQWKITKIVTYDHKL